LAPTSTTTSPTRRRANDDIAADVVLARTHEDETPLGGIVVRGATQPYAVDLDVEAGLRVLEIVAEEAAGGAAHNAPARQLDTSSGDAAWSIGAPFFGARCGARGTVW
jgi:hypothetical protein